MNNWQTVYNWTATSLQYNTDVHLVCPDGLILASLITTAAISLYNNYYPLSVLEVTNYFVIWFGFIQLYSICAMKISG